MSDRGSAFALCIGLVLGASTLSGCSEDGDEPDAITYDCRQAMVDAEMSSLDERDAFIEKTLSVCADAEDWRRALVERPGAFGMKTYTYDQTAESLEVACFVAEQATVCKDAKERGWVKYFE